MYKAQLAGTCTSVKQLTRKGFDEGCCDTNYLNTADNGTYPI